MFLRVTEAGTFSAAGRVLGLSPSAVSKLIARVERRLGVSLFDRTSRGLSLTEEGAAYQRHGRRLVSDLDQIERSLAARMRALRGRLVVAAPSAFADHQLVPVVPDFLGLHPALEIDLVVTHETAGATPLVEAADVEIRAGTDHHDGTLRVHKLATSRPLVVASPAYVAARGAPGAPAELMAHNCLRRNGPHVEGEWSFVVDGGVCPSGAFGNLQSDTAEALRQLALGGLGIAWLPDFMVARDVREGRLVPLLTEYLGGHEVPVRALFVGHAQLSARVRAFVDFVALRFGRASPWS